MEKWRTIVFIYFPNLTFKRMETRKTTNKKRYLSHSIQIFPSIPSMRKRKRRSHKEKHLVFFMQMKSSLNYITRKVNMFEVR